LPPPCKAGLFVELDRDAGRIIIKKIFIFIFSVVVLNVRGVPVADVIAGVKGGARQDFDSLLEMKIEPSGDMSIPSVKITSFKSTLTQERTYSTNGDSNFPYIRITEEFSTNLFLTFREGGTTKSGERVANEAVFETPDYPVIGIALFASRYQQARLLSLLNNRIVEDGEYAGGPAYVISGYVEKPVNMKITQIYSKADYLLLEQSISSDKAPLNV